MNRHARNDLKELRVFLVALGIIIVALVLMTFALAIIWKRVPVPTVQDDSASGTQEQAR